MSVIREKDGTKEGAVSMINPKEVQVNLHARSLRPMQRERIIEDKKLKLKILKDS